MTESEWLKCNDPEAMIQDLATWRGLSGRPKFGCRKFRLFACACCRQLDSPRDTSLQAIETAERFADGQASRTELGQASRTELDQATWRLASDAEVISPTPIFILHWDDPADCARDVLRNMRASGWPGDWALLADLLRCIAGNPWQRLHYFWCDGRLYPSVGAMSDVRYGDGKRVLSVDDKNIPVPWLTPQVLGLAEAAYHWRTEPEWSCCCGSPLDGSHDHEKCGPPVLEMEGGLLEEDRLLILSDALEDEGLVEPCSRCEGHGQVAVVAGLADRWLPDEEGVPFKRLRTSCPDCQATGVSPHGLLAHLRSPGPHVRGCHAVDLILGKE